MIAADVGAGSVEGAGSVGIGTVGAGTDTGIEGIESGCSSRGVVTSLSLVGRELTFIAPPRIAERVLLVLEINLGELIHAPSC